MLAALTLLHLAAMQVPGDGTQPHEVEIKLFANTAAMAEVASDRCPDILVNRTLISAMQEKLHIRPMDGPAVSDEARATRDTLQKAVAAAASPQAWCDATYKLYGPEGAAIRGLMIKAVKP